MKTDTDVDEKGNPVIVKDTTRQDQDEDKELSSIKSFHLNFWKRSILL